MGWKRNGNGILAFNFMLVHCKWFRLISFRKWYYCVKCFSNKTTTLTGWRGCGTPARAPIQNSKSKLNSLPHDCLYRTENNIFSQNLEYRRNEQQNFNHAYLSNRKHCAKTAPSIEPFSRWHHYCGAVLHSRCTHIKWTKNCDCRVNENRYMFRLLIWASENCERCT